MSDEIQKKKAIKVENTPKPDNPSGDAKLKCEELRQRIREANEAWKRAQATNQLEQEKPPEPLKPEKRPVSEERPSPGGYCSCYPVSKAGVKASLKKRDPNKSDPPRTSDLYYTCNLPARFDHPHWFNGYGCQTDKQHPLYRTTTSEYGWYPPGYCSVPNVYYPSKQKFSNHLIATGNYRNYSLNTDLKDGTNSNQSNPCTS